MEGVQRSELLAYSAEIVASYVGNHQTASEAVPDLIATVFTALERAGNPASAQGVLPEPAVPLKKSVTPDYIICLEDGKRLKMLRRYLRNRYNLTPDDYRRRWGLPSDYPMVAPNHSERRKDIAKAAGLGTRHRAAP